MQCRHLRGGHGQRTCDLHEWQSTCRRCQEQKQHLSLSPISIWKKFSTETMRSFTAAVTLLATVAAVGAFTASTLPSSRSASLTVTYGYVPSGLSADEWKKIKEKETQKTKNLGKLGPRGFKSRSFQSFQEALERGEATHLMPVENAKERIAKGELKLSDIPYMQRGGAWVSVWQLLSKGPRTLRLCGTVF
jgi:hypothetical protein